MKVIAVPGKRESMLARLFDPRTFPGFRAVACICNKLSHPIVFVDRELKECMLKTIGSDA